MFISLIKRMIALLMSFLFLTPSLLSGKQYAGDMETEGEEEPVLVFAAISDVHLTDSAARANMLAMGLYDMQCSVRPLDALLLCGDNTDSGYQEEEKHRPQYELLADTLAQYTPAKRILLAEGNHDTWTADDYGPAKDLFIEYNQRICGRELTEPYYAETVNGVTFIILGSEHGSVAAVYSEKQLNWLREQMAAADHSKPVFVVSHQPFNGTHGLPYTWGLESDPDPDVGGMGDQSDEVKDILSAYPNVYLISGHIHSGFSNETTAALDPLFNYVSVERVDGVTSVNLPSYMYPAVRGAGFNGQGYVFEVYADRVVIRARSFSAGVWLYEYSYTFYLR